MEYMGAFGLCICCFVRKLYFGRDVFAGILNGSKIAFWVGLLSVFISLIIGIPVGLITGYYGNAFKIGWIEFILVLIPSLFFIYYIIYFRPDSIFLIIGLLLAFGLFKLALFYSFDRFLPNRRTFNLPVDDMMTKIIEIFKSIPVLIIMILLLGMVSEPGIVSISFFLGFLYWIRIARYIRAEVLSLRESDFINAQKAMGNSDYSIMLRHCLPKALPPVLVAVIFLFGSTILLEATLSFFGLGIPLDQVSWGSLLSESKNYLGAWGMAVFPGLCLYAVIASLAKESEYWSARFNPQLKDF